MDTSDPTEGLSFYDEEMEECACGYAEYVLSLVEEAKKTCKDPVVLIEQRLDFSRYVEEGFGTGDCVIIADGTLYIIDYKHGKGVEVSAEGNPQMMLYALGALELFDGIYDMRCVRTAGRTGCFNSTGPTGRGGFPAALYSCRTFRRTIFLIWRRQGDW